MSEIVSADRVVQQAKGPIDWRFLRNCVIGTAITVSAAGVFGSFVGGNETAEDIAEKNTLEATISTTQQQISNYKNDTVIYEQRDNELQELYGSACLAALFPYNSEPLLKATSIDQVVSDLISDTQQPCGSEPTEVRIAAVDVDKTKSNLERLSKIDYTGLVTKLQQSQEAYAAEGSNTKRLIGTFAMGALGLGVCIFCIVPQSYRFRKSVKEEL